ncbi:hypothetical protein niasHT_002485 [Heterodera trifolii]|uniref:B30.2/SPRY domain-containing protein n=1 Tax=Heterodera trifolii TaxID=157864 RepID=A0ABD2LME6_9BILA
MSPSVNSDRPFQPPGNVQPVQQPHQQPDADAELQAQIEDAEEDLLLNWWREDPTIIRFLFGNRRAPAIEAALLQRAEHEAEIFLNNYPVPFNSPCGQVVKLLASTLSVNNYPIPSNCLCGQVVKLLASTLRAAEERFSQLQNDQKKILEKISETEKQRKKKVFLKFQENCWDSFACDNLIEIIGDKSLIVHHKGNATAWRSVFAKYPIVLNKHLSDFFYYEISVQKKEKSNWVMFGFAVKQQTKLDGPIHREKGTYAFYSNGYIWINGKGKGRNAEYSYGVGDTVGIGVNSASRQMIFTKNGLRLDTSDFLVDPSFADGFLYPFVSLLRFGDKIEANFGPNFKFDLETL